MESCRNTRCCSDCNEVPDVEVAEEVPLSWLGLLLAVCEVDESGSLLRQDVCNARPDVRVWALLANDQFG